MALSSGLPATFNTCLGMGNGIISTSVVSKAKTACEVAGHTVLDHFADAGKMVSLGSGSQREVPDMMEKEDKTDGRDRNDLPNYSVARESPLGSCHRGGTFIVILKRQNHSGAIAKT